MGRSEDMTPPQAQEAGIDFEEIADLRARAATTGPPEILDRYALRRLLIHFDAALALLATHEGEKARPLQHNPEPVEVVSAKLCVGCGKRAPWCSCGALDYRESPPVEAEGEA